MRSPVLDPAVVPGAGTEVLQEVNVTVGSLFRPSLLRSNLCHLLHSETAILYSHSGCLITRTVWYCHPNLTGPVGGQGAGCLLPAFSKGGPD